MINNEPSEYAHVMESQPILYSVLVVCVLSIIYTSLDLAFKFSSGGVNVLTDFHAFYIVGQMFKNESVEHAYHFKTMFEAQNAFMGTQSFMPWSYPPQFNFIVAGLPILPLGLSYLFFVLFSFSCYIFTLRYLSGPYLAAVLISIAPALLITIRCGQNGFITGTLIGLFIIALPKRRFYAGLVLGLMVIKPHLAVGITLISFILRRWSVMATAAMIVLLSSLFVTFYSGQGIWIAFISGAREASKFLELGLYPLNRMISIYASFLSFGFSAGLALTAQIVVALSSCFIVFFTWRRNWKPDRMLGISALATLYVSPYGYDYDLTILGVALSILIQDIAKHATNKEKLSMLALSWFGCGFGLVTNYFYQKTISSSLLENRILSLAGICLVLLFFIIFNVIKRSQDCDNLEINRENISSQL